jgi:phage shock protein C
MKKFYKSKTNKVWKGIIGGVGEYFDIDPSLLRLFWLFIALSTGFFPALIAYIFAATIIPEKPDGQ